MKKRDIILDFTSLLDVIMIMLFLVMGSMSKVSGENAEAAEEAQQKLQEANAEIAELQDTINMQEDIKGSYAVYQSEAVIITMRNSERNGSHILLVSEGENADNLITVPLGENTVNNTRARVNNYISEILDRTENQPVYIVFYYDKYSIYRSEFDAVIGELEIMQRDNKQVFYKKVEK